MENRLWKKGLVFGIIILFFGASVVPSITGHDKDVEKIDYMLHENETLDMKNDDYNNLIKQVIENGVISKNNWLEQDKLLASDGATDDLFGLSVSIDGDYAIVGAYQDDDNGEDSGSAYIFNRSGTTWTQQTKLLASDGAADDLFGYSVSIDGDYAIVGAYWDDDNGDWSGSAYIFNRSGSTWIQQAKLLASDGAAGDWFGWSVSIDGDYAIVGASYDDDNRANSGSSYIFNRSGSTWIQQAKLLASDGAAFDRFGWSVSIDRDYAIVGARYDDDNGVDSGSSYVFNRSGSTWIQQAKLLASDGAAFDRFGCSVSIDGDYAIIGAYKDDDNGDDSGSAYIFNRSGTTWTQQAKLLASDGAYNDEFGGSVSINGDYAIVGAIYDDDNGDNSGSAYIFTRSGTVWTEQAKLLASDGAAVDLFGLSVSIDGDYVIVGAYWDDDNGVDSGSAYVFTRSSENQPPLLSGESPADDSENISINLTSVSVYIEDPEGDAFNWSIEGEYVITNSSTNDVNGTKSASLITPLPYDTNIVWYVNVTDGYNSINITYNFFTQILLQPTIYVDDDAPPEWYDATHVRTIQEGINNATDGGTVFVYNGTYYGNVVVDKAITLMGEDRNNTIIDGGGYEKVVSILVDNVALCGFAIQNNSDVHSSIGIYINAKFTNVSGNRISNGDYDSGIRLDSSNNNTIMNNIVYSINNTLYNRGILLVSSSGNTISGNNFSNNYFGIYFSRSNYNYIAQNIINSNIGNGINIQSKSNHNTIQGNMISLNDGGGIISFGSNNNISENTFNLNDVYGISLSGSNNIVSGNTFSNNDRGIHIVYSSNQIVSENTIVDNDEGIYVGSSDSNIISNNTILDNDKGIYLRYSDNNMILNNDIYNNYCGISLLEANNNNIERCVILNNTAGLFVEQSLDNTISTNVFNDCVFGMWLNTSSGNIAEQNTITNCNYETYHWFKNYSFESDQIVYQNDPNYDNYSSFAEQLATGQLGDEPLYTKEVLVDKATLFKVHIIGQADVADIDLGIFLDGKNGNPIDGVTQTGEIVDYDADFDADETVSIFFPKDGTYLIRVFGFDVIGNPGHFDMEIWISSENSTAIISENSASIITENLINDNIAGICLDEQSIASNIYHNNLINNTQQAHDEGTNTWDNGYPSGGNYWDDYTGTDTDGDGIGDTPYDIDGGSNQDLYPLMYLWGENPPVANFTYSADYLSVTFDASSSYDRDGSIVDYVWDFGDDEYGNGITVNHTYSEGGEYPVTLTVIDDDGYEGNITKTIVVEPLNQPPYTPSAPQPPDGAVDVDIDADLSWSGGDPDTGDTVTYDVYFGTTSPPPQVTNNQTELTYDPGTLTYETTYYWQIVAWDNHGASTEGPIWDFTTEEAPDPDLDCDGSLSWTDVTPGDTVTGSFTVSNIGDSGSLLDWEIVDWPDWGTWTFDPESGTGLLPGTPVTVDVEVVAPDEPETEFEGEIKIVNSENPSDYCIIPVSLITPVSQNAVNSPILQLPQRLLERFPLLEQILANSNIY